MSRWLEASIVGVGQTEFSKNAGRSPLTLSVEAVTAALADAGLTMDDVDGLVTSAVDSSDPALLAETLGLEAVTFFAATPYGGGGICAAVQEAAMAVISGVASTVVVYRGLTGRSGTRYGQGYPDASLIPYMAVAGPFGSLTPAHQFSINAARYMHEYGVTNADFAPISVAARAHAATNPAAHFYGQPVTVEDHQSSKWIVEPVLRLLDCCMESDGAIAFVVTGTDRAADTPHGPVKIAAASQGTTWRARIQLNYYGDTVTRLPEVEVLGAKMWQDSGLKPEDVDVALLYDHFTALIPLQLEALGYCGPGEGTHLVRERGIQVGGGLPINPHGGMLGEAYIHGMNGIAEGVRQLRGTAVNQVADARTALATTGPGTPASGLILVHRDF